MSTAITIRTRRRPVLSGIALLAGFCALALLSWQFEYWRVSQQQHSRLRLQADDLDRRLSQLAVLPRMLSSDPRLRQALVDADAESVARANRALAQAQRDSGVAFAFLMDHSGLTVAASNWRDEVSFVGRNYRFRPYFSGAMAGVRSTFFAVGATTGVPGYFIADGVRDGDAIVGVVVVKLELDQLLSSWQADRYTSVLLDELGVVILSTDADLLYTPARELNEGARAAIAEDRRYVVSAQSTLSPSHSPLLPGKRWIWHRADASSRGYVAVDHRLASEPWTLRHLLPTGSITLLAASYLIAFAGLAALALLTHRSYRQQRLFAQSQRRNAEQLEAQVQARTRELESAQRALIAEANFAMLGRLSAAINHEINQPLASLRFNLATLRKLIESPSASEDDIRDAVIDSDRTTKRIARVIDTLRNLARQRNTNFSTVDVNRLLIDVVQIVRRERPIASKALAGEPIRLAAGGAVSGNEVLLQQALLNLLYNAFDATLAVAQPRVQLRALSTDAGVEIQVDDNGEGVAPEVQEQLFEPFATHSGRASGLGLGLTLARQIVIDHGGRLDYRPGASGGSLFIISLPLVDGAGS